VVYLGRVEGAAGFAKPVVVKTISPHLTSDPTMEKLFAREARILSHLQHPNIVGVVDFGNTDAGYVMVLEYVHGYHVGQWAKFLRLSSRRISVDNAVYTIGKVLDALEYAHTLKRADGSDSTIVHRDVSPANILIDLSGSVKLYDFGIARMTEDVGEYRTQEGTFKGTISFTAPEVLLGNGATPASDVYAAAVILYQLLAGQNPFTGKELRETLHRVLTLVPPPVSEHRKDLPSGLAEVVSRGLSKAKEDRYPSAAAFARALRSTQALPEEQIAAAFATDVQDDFLVDLPGKLRIESLEIRDAAWRVALDGPDSERISLRLAVQASHSSAPPTRHEGVLPQLPEDRPTIAKRPSWLVSDAAGRRSRLWLAASIAVAGAAAVAAALLLKAAPPSASKPRFVMIEKRTPDGGAAPGSTTGTSTGAAPPLSAGVAESPSPAKTAGSQVSAPPVVCEGEPARLRSALSATFQLQQSKIESCFERFAQDVVGRPNLSVQFQVQVDGSVKSADLTPAALSSSAMGGCLLQVARATRFQALEEPMSFSIPITARRVPR